MVPSVDVGPGYFAALDIPVLRGRPFTPADREDAEPVAIVSELLARRIFGDVDVAGRMVTVGTGTTIQGGRVVADEGTAARIVGVVGDVRQLALVMEPDPVLYRPVAQARTRDQTLLVRTSGAAAAALDPARAAVREVDPGLLVSDAGALRQATLRVFGPLRVRTVLVVTLAGLAGFLILVGIYGVVAYVVSDRTHEIGLRMALGARAGGESTRMVRDAMRPVTAGALLGTGVAAAVSGVLERQEILFGVGRHDVPTYAVVLALLLGMAAMSAWLPARRAAAVDPMRVLNEE
jgi:putative ABC transport system permease protein